MAHSRVAWDDHRTAWEYEMLKRESELRLHYEEKLIRAEEMRNRLMMQPYQQACMNPYESLETYPDIGAPVEKPKVKTNPLLLLLENAGA